VSEVEDRAKAMGWVPQDEFRGDPEKWRSAEEFLDIGLNYMPVLKERLGKMEKDLADKTSRLERTTENLVKFTEFHKGTYKRAYNKALEDIETKKRIAAQAGDVEAYDLLSREAEAVHTEAAQLETSPTQPADSPVYQDWHEKNTWYTNDKDLTAYADGLAQMLREDNFVGSEAAFYGEIEKRVRANFPHKFVNPAQAQPPAVEAAGGPGELKGPAKKKKFEDIPAEDRAEYNKHFKEIINEKDYARDYWAQFEE